MRHDSAEIISAPTVHTLRHERSTSGQPVGTQAYVCGKMLDAGIGGGGDGAPMLVDFFHPQGNGRWANWNGSILI